jgi:hypothetical protein
MKKFIIVCMLLLSLGVYAQRQTEYNSRGDEAMENKDYRDAKMWYEEGMAYCDSYSIDQLMKIWQADESMHLSMRTAMTNCLGCLNDLALENDTVAMKKLIVFYTEGIGTTRNESSAGYWKNQLEQIRQPRPTTVISDVIAPKEKMNFLIGYHFSPIVPFGIQIGGFNSKLGWYLRLHSDFSFQNADGNLKVVKEGEDHQVVLEGVEGIQYAGYKKTDKFNSTVMGSVGMMVKPFTDTYLSVGLGYWQGDVLRQYESLDDEGNGLSEFFWVKDPDHAHKGVVVDADAVFLFGGRFYGTAGCSVLNFKYVYPNVGIGIYF